MSCTDCDNCEEFCTSEITCVDANFTNLSVAGDATLNDVLEAIDEGMVSLKGDKGDKGDTGDTGATGANGANGARGNAGGNSLIFDSSIDPVLAGGLSLDESGMNLTDVTVITLNHTSKADYTGTNSTTGNAVSWEAEISAGDIIQITSVDTPAHYGVYTVTAKTIGSSYNDYTVSLLAANSIDPVGQYTVSFIKKGNAGTNGVDSVSPVGAIQMYAGTSAPTGYLFCIGQQVLRSTYASLFAVIGTTYGTGDGSTTFNVPNFQGRVPIGVGAIPDGGSVALAETGGNALHLIDANELPAHTHPIHDPGHEHNVSANNSDTLTPGINPAQAAIGNLSTANPYLKANSNTTGITATNNNSTTHTAMSLLQPYLVLNFIIKY